MGDEQPQGAAPAQSSADLIAARLERVERDLGGIGQALGSFTQQQRASAAEAQIQQRLAAAGAAVSKAEQAYRAARETGDLDAELAANRAMAAAVADQRRVEAEIENFRAQVARASAGPQKLDDTELQKFRAANPWFGTDAELTQTSIAFAREIEASGVVKGTPAYFAEVTRRMRERYPDRIGAASPPVAGGGMGGAPLSPGAMRFSPEQLQTWRTMGIDTSNPETLKALASARQQAAALRLVPEQPPSSLGRIMTR